jgi:diguanylate cyclase (GGDEF)-like protein
MATALESRFEGAAVHVADTGGQVLERLASGDCDLLILDHDLPGVSASDIVRRLTEGAGSARTPVLYCVTRDAEREGARSRVERFGVRTFLTHPFGAADLIECVAALLLPKRANGAGESGPATVLATALAGNGEGVAPQTIAGDSLGSAVTHRMDILDRAAVSLLDGADDVDALASAREEAAVLAGVLIASGRHDGASLAREIEQVLDVDAQIDTLRLSELVVALRAELQRPVTSSDLGGPADTRPLLVVLDGGSGFGETVGLEAEARGLRCRTVVDASQLRSSLSEESPAVILIDLDVSPVRDAAVAMIGEIETTAPMTPVVVATSAGSLTSRVAIARAGGYRLLRKPVSPTVAIDTVISAIRRAHVSGCRLLAVDDDAVGLADLRERLEPMGVELTVLHDARRFWEEIEVLRPDVILLGMNARHHSGLELCRVLRADDRWVSLPVIVLGEAPDPAAMHLAFLAGADDFVPKPLVARDIVTRVANRLERHRGVQEAAGTDPLTGVATRRRSEEALNSLLRLAIRYRQPFSIAAINVDGLREVNESIGIAAGDAVLRRLGRLLRNSFRSEDVVGRWGGDQFIFGGFGLEKDDCVRRLRRISERLGRDPFRGGDIEINVGFSAGVATLFSDGIDLSSLQHAAEDTLAHAKSVGRSWILPSGWSADRTDSTEVVDIVLVEGDTALAGMLTHTLEQAGWSTRWFRDAAEAMGQLCGSKPLLRAGAILLEVELPGRDGFSVLRALSRDGVLARSRVIMLTARANETEVLKAFDLGAMDHVAKPFSVQVLLRRIRRAIRVPVR